jgi:hypothetical protein
LQETRKQTKESVDMKLRPRLTYANVAATLALVLALGGGTVYAANQLSKNSVRSKHIAKGAVKRPDLGRNAVTSPKVKDGGIKAADIAAGVIPKVQAQVTGSATAGPQGGIDANTTLPLPLGGATTFTPRAGEVAALAAEGRFTIATANAGQSCQPAVFLLLNGEPTRVFVSPDSGGDSPTPVAGVGRDADGPFGLLAPGTPLTISAELRGDPDCTAGSRLDRLEIRTVQIR